MSRVGKHTIWAHTYMSWAAWVLGRPTLVLGIYRVIQRNRVAGDFLLCVFGAGVYEDLHCGFPGESPFVGVGTWGTGGQHRKMRGVVGEDLMMTTTSARC